MKPESAFAVQPCRMNFKIASNCNGVHKYVVTTAIMAKVTAAFVLFALFTFTLMDVQGQSTTPSPSHQPAPNPQDYMSILNQGIKLLSGNSMTGDLLQQVSKISSLLPMMNEQTLMNILRNLNINVTSSQIDGALKLAQGALSAVQTLQENNTSLNPFAKSQESYSQISSECKGSMGILGAQVLQQKTWALGMIDAWGKPQSGISTGSTHWLGNFDECLAIQPEVNGKTPFEVTYCGISFPIHITDQTATLYLGMCLPKTCNYYDVLNISKTLVASIPVSQPLNANYALCKTEIEYDTRAIVAIIVCSFFLALMVFATIFDIFIVSPELERIAKSTVVEVEDASDKTSNGISQISKGENGVNHQQIELELNAISQHIQTNGNDSGSLYKVHDAGVRTKVNKPVSNYPGICAKLVLSFSVWTNGRKLLSTEQAGGTLGAVNGIRFLSMTWVILGHTYVFALLFQTYVNPLSFMQKMLKRPSFMAIDNALLSVDTFFTLSGLLVSYLFMKEMKRERGRINWFMFYFHRFWRLTPPYMLVMMIDIALFRYFGDGPTWTPFGFEIDFCKDSWWTNLIYLNNFLKVDKQCFAWSWYLANDMQFYVISPLLLVPLYFSKKIGGFVCAMFLLGVTITPAVISAHYQLPSSQFTLIPSPHAANYFPEYYIKPYCRMGPYIVGILTGYILYKTGNKYKISKPLNLLIWAFVAALACVVLYGTYQESNGHPMSVSIAAMYNALHKSLWGVCVSWVVFACVTGNGGYVNTLLSWSPFVPLGRLTYCAYLVHPIIMAAYYKMLRQGVYATDFSIIYLFFGHLVLSYMVAFVVSLAFESPMMGLERTILKKDKKK
ncbi:O-acyltransferase like protein-like [Ylistrum balloti]|uniref:O-acyltransferase like protein-like n=1 Tax=Ylistrum balloti TaxID=509963 RepID=UPI0029057EF9|nr:O-acyltransferase like protein-like [Ylistrum balloti]